MKKTAVILRRLLTLIGLVILVLLTTAQTAIQIAGACPARIKRVPMYDPSTFSSHPVDSTA